MAMELAGLQSRSRWLRQSLLDPGETRVKTLVLDIFDLLVHIITKKRDRQTAEDMGYVVYKMEGRTFTMSVLMDLDKRGLLPTGVASKLLCTIWTYDVCFRTKPSAADPSVKYTSMKDFKRFLDRCMCTRDILLADMVVAANSLNHPYNAVHPPQFVQHLARASNIDRRIIWRNVPRSQAMALAGFWRAMLVCTRVTDCPGDDCPPAPEAEDPTLEPEEPTREPDEPTSEPAVLAEESARVLPSVQDRPSVGLGRPTLGVPCSRRLPLFE
ncbi:hypothetical protein R1sor_017894 [Riccia sorocarpa]|uniref:Uncharacterized protein n=1 Tax=Riccia sorocarpa TaxID=122646 RepID=A0ABD3I899_9MARC